MGWRKRMVVVVMILVDPDVVAYWDTDTILRIQRIYLIHRQPKKPRDDNPLRGVVVSDYDCYYYCFRSGWDSVTQQ
jgi:hypothetical protein